MLHYIFISLKNHYSKKKNNNNNNNNLSLPPENVTLLSEIWDPVMGQTQRPTACVITASGQAFLVLSSRWTC